MRNIDRDARASQTKGREGERGVRDLDLEEALSYQHTLEKDATGLDFPISVQYRLSNVKGDSNDELQ